MKYLPVSLVLLVLVPLTAFAQEESTPDVWEPLRYFVGSWEGELSGMSGVGTGERECHSILGDNFLHVTNVARFEPSEGQTEGEVHQDRGYFSYDKGREQLILREFHVEGFYNQYVVDTISSDGKRIVMTSEFIENGPPGLKARYVLTIISDDEYSDVFELAFGGQEFACYSEGHWTRKRVE